MGEAEALLFAFGWRFPEGGEHLEVGGGGAACEAKAEFYEAEADEEEDGRRGQQDCVGTEPSGSATEDEQRNHCRAVAQHALD